MPALQQQPNKLVKSNSFAVIFHSKNNLFQSLLALRFIRKSMEDTAGSESIYLRDESFLHMMRHFLHCHGREDLQLEASWIVTNIAAGSSANTLLVS
jgi:hypothetical protein